MRLLVSCSECERKYDATKQGLGGVFRCHCGNLVQAMAPSGHDARVVRCSSCGAPREGQSQSCIFCRADFTLHEQDLETVCPQCFARVSDQARYCHHCGAGLQAESPVGEETLFCCPHCGEDRHLSNRLIGKQRTPVMECHGCAGLWLSKGVFEELTKLASEKAGTVEELMLQAREPDRVQSATPWRYRPCPQCGQYMQRRNYARESGVILDICRAHGLWFDASELPSILRFVREGGLKRAKQREQEESRRQEEREREKSRAGFDPAPFSPAEGPGDSLLDLVINSMFGLF